MLQSEVPLCVQRGEETQCVRRGEELLQYSQGRAKNGGSNFTISCKFRGEIFFMKIANLNYSFANTQLRWPICKNFRTGGIPVY